MFVICPTFESAVENVFLSSSVIPPFASKCRSSISSGICFRRCNHIDTNLQQTPTHKLETQTRMPEYV